MDLSKINREDLQKAIILGYDRLIENDCGFITKNGVKYILVNKYGHKWIFYLDRLTVSLAKKYGWQKGKPFTSLIDNKYAAYDKWLAEQLTVEHIQYLVEQRKFLLENMENEDLNDESEETYIRRQNSYFIYDLCTLMECTDKESYDELMKLAQAKYENSTITISSEQQTSNNNDGYEIGDDSALLELLSVNDNDIQNID